MRGRRLELTQICLLILTVLAVFYTLYFAAGILLPMVMAVVSSLLLNAPMRFLHQHLRLPKPLVALLLVLLMFGFIVAVGTAISVPAAGWLERAPESLAAAETKLAMLRRPLQAFQNSWLRMQGPLGVQPVDTLHSGSLGTGLSAFGSTLFLGTRVFMGQFFTFVLMLFFLLAQGDSLLRRIVEIMPSYSDKRRMVQIASQVERNISRYLATITVINMIVGLANMVQCWIVGMPNPLLWGVAAFLLNYIPIIGPLCGMVIYFFVGLFVFPSALEALPAPMIYLCIHLLEGETITPILLARRFTLNPVLVMASLMFWDWLWGITGAFLSVPMLAVFKILCDHVEALTPLGHVIGGARRMQRRDRRVVRSD